MTERKRATVHIFDRFLPAWDLHRRLKAVGIDAVLITRHAVQVHPDHIEQTKRALSEMYPKRKL